MCHLKEKHLNKNDEELIYRLLTEWKSNVGTFFYDITNRLQEAICMNKFISGEETIYIYKFNEDIGYGFNRKFQELRTEYARIVCDSHNNIITGYPELSMGYMTGNTYDFDLGLLYQEYKNPHFNSNLWNTFVDLTQKNLKYEIRFIVDKKNPQIRVYLNDQFTLKINKNYDVKIFNNGHLYKEFNCNKNELYDYIINPCDLSI